MNLQDIVTIIEEGRIDDCISVCHTHSMVTLLVESLQQIDPALHEINDPVYRPDPYIKDEAGNNIEKVKLNRIALPMQKKIVLTAAAFLGTPTMQATPDDDIQQTMFDGLHQIEQDNKLDYKFTSIAEKRMTYKHCAELWYTEDTDPEYWSYISINGTKKPKMMLLSPDNGDSMYPVFDEFRDMVAFGRGYRVKGVDGKDVDHFDVYTADWIYMAKKTNEGWLFATRVGEDLIYNATFTKMPNLVKKIPVVYYYQLLTEWEDVQPLIERIELIMSNHADTNDYVGSPIVFMDTDQIKSFPKKGQAGKIIQAQNGAKVSYLTYDAQPLSVKMELENLQKYAYSLSHTPDVSFENMSGLGYFSTVAMQTMFMDAHLKARRHTESFGECLQRRYNLLKAFLVYIDPKLKPGLKLRVTPKFELFIPKNFVEELQNIVTAKNNGLISTETAIKAMPDSLVSDHEAEIEKIKAEQQDKQVKEIEKAKQMAAINPKPAFAAN